LASGRSSRGSVEYIQVRSRVTRSGHNAPHQVGTLGPVGGGANATVAALLQAEQIIDAGPKRVFLLSAFQITETKEGGMIIITTTRVTQMLHIVKTLQEGQESA